MNETEWRHVFERARIELIRGTSNSIEVEKMIQHLVDADRAKKILIKTGYGHSGMMLSEIAGLVVPF